MTIDLNQLELSWAAGFYDGEGTIWYKKPVRTGERSSRGGRGQLRISIQQTDPEVLERFRDAVHVGRVTGPWVRKTPTASPFWQYEAHRFSEVMAVVGFLWRFLSSAKRDQFERTIARHLSA